MSNEHRNSDELIQDGLLKKVAEIEEKAANDDSDSIVSKSLKTMNSFLDDAANEDVDFNSDEERILAYGRYKNVLYMLLLMEKAKGFDKDTAFPKPSENESFQAFCKRMIENKENAVSEIEAKVTELKNEAERLKAALEDAEAADDVEAILSYTENMEENKKKLNVTIPIYEKMKNKPALENGFIRDTWAKYAKLFKSEWAIRLEIVKAAADLYHESCNRLSELTHQLNEVRAELQIIEKENGSGEDITHYNQIITESAIRTDLNLMKRDENENLKRAVFFKMDALL